MLHLQLDTRSRVKNDKELDTWNIRKHRDKALVFKIFQKKSPSIFFIQLKNTYRKTKLMTKKQNTDAFHANAVLYLPVISSENSTYLWPESPWELIFDAEIYKTQKEDRRKKKIIFLQPISTLLELRASISPTIPCDTNYDAQKSLGTSFFISAQLCQNYKAFTI